MLELKKVTIKEEEKKAHICTPCPCLPWIGPCPPVTAEQ